MKKIKILSILLLIIISVVVIYNYPRLNIISGYSAKMMSSSVFLANRPVSLTDNEDNNFSPIHIANDEVNLDKKWTTASVYGLMKRKAMYREGLGSVLVSENYTGNKQFLKPKRNLQKTGFPYPYGELPQRDTVFKNINYDSLNKAVVNAFDIEGEEKAKKTRAVLVIYKNQIIAEKYANGFDKHSKFLGWSMTKSITSAVVGIMDKKGLVNIHQNNLFKEWSQDNRKSITLNNLLQMNTGLEWDEDYNTMSDVTKMLFLEEDMSATQLNKPLIGKPNESWNYSSGTTNLISGFIRSQFKTHQEYLNFWYRELIDKIGMHSMTIETDLSGNYVGSSYGWATARDWAKFGLLYLNKGNWNGEQIISEDWVAYSTTPTNSSNGAYGAQFWLNAGKEIPNAPTTMFSCNGYQGQRIFIIPSKELVIVRLGLSEEPGFDFNKFLKEVFNSFSNPKIN